MPLEFDNGGGKPVGEAVVIKAYFGMRPGDRMQEFMGELRVLTPEAKSELAAGAAKELGWKNVTISGVQA